MVLLSKMLSLIESVKFPSWVVTVNVTSPAFKAVMVVPEMETASSLSATISNPWFVALEGETSMLNARL